MFLESTFLAKSMVWLILWISWGLFPSFNIEKRISNHDVLLYEKLEQNEIYNDLIKSINKLSKNQRITIILLFGLDGQTRSQKEISEILNISQSRVSKLKKTAIKNLQKLITQYIQEEYKSKVKIK